MALLGLLQLEDINMAKEIKTIGVLTSGGDAPGMNAAIRAVVRAGISSGLKVKGIRRGYAGLMEEDIFDMGTMSVTDIVQRGGTILFTSRCRRMMTPEGQKMAADICRKHGIDGIVVIGGDGSFRGAQKLSENGINTIGIPGTIDLDIACTEYTIGFDTACNTAMEAIDKVRDTSASHERCSIIEVMGRTAGHIALWCGISNGSEYVLIPERHEESDEQAIIDKILSKRRKVWATLMRWQRGLRKPPESRPGPLSLDISSVVATQPAVTVSMHLLWERWQWIFCWRERQTAW